MRDFRVIALSMTDPAAFLPVEGEMAERIRAFDWSATPLGPIASWPQSLQSVIGLCLYSGFPTAIYWGSDLRLIYNDAWSVIPAERHPAALGQPAAQVWSDIWGVVGPQMVEVLTTGRGFATYEQLLPMIRGGRPRETYWNYSFTPIPAEDGSIAGILNQGNEVTEAVFERKRQDFLLRFSDDLRSIDEPREIIRTAQQLLGQHLKANRVGYGEVDESERYFTTTDNWTDGVPSRHGTHDLAGFGPDIHNGLRRGEPLILEDAREDPRTSAPEALAAFEAIDTQAALTASLIKGGRMVAALYVHTKAPRSWTDADAQTVQDVAERTWSELARARAEAQAGASEERYRRMFEQTSDLVLTADLNQQITDCNPAAAAAVGMTREDAIGRNIAEFISPDDYAMTSGMLQQKLRDGGNTRYDVRVQSRSGELLYWEINSGLTHDELGKPTGLYVVGRDATERRRWEHHQRLLVAELNHRVKNTLSIVQSLAHQTFKAGKPPADAIQAYEGRLSALATAHNLLTQANWEAASIRAMAAQALSPFCGDGRCSTSGPDLRLTPQMAVSLTLALHELATNASKYGALSDRGGRVSIEWSDGEGRLHLKWEEHDGPPVAAPTSSGFGTRMLKRALAADLEGNVELDYRASGLVCTIDCRLPEIASA